MSSGDLIARQGGKEVRIPIPRIDIPRFRFGQSQGGVGQGPGNVGDGIGDDDGQQGPGGGKAGQGEGDKEVEVEVTLQELAEIMAETLSLPNIEPKGTRQVEAASTRYSSIRPVGPDSLRSFKRTYKQALRRMVSSGEYDPGNPVVTPRKEDRRFRASKTEMKPATNAVIVYMMDVSGSMGDEQKEIVRIESFWIDTWLRSQYKGIQSRYIVHDASAREVDQQTFFTTRESGGTMISSAYRLCLDIIEREYPVEDWNIYPFHFSDGDNWSVDDTSTCMRLLRDDRLPKVNLFCYGQVDSPYGSGQFIKDLREKFAADERVALSEIKNRERILDSIRDFLGRGK
jgi:hypothetical protein